MNLDDLDRKIIKATQSGLSVCVHPYKKVAESLDIEEVLLLERLKKMKDEGVVRRVALVPNHYTLGYKANGMSVWQIKPEAIDKVGKTFGELPYVSHCYERATHGELWDYNIFAMVHGHQKEEVNELILQMHELIEKDCIQHDVLFSEKILKKTGLRIK